MEQEGHLPFADLSVCRQSYRMTAGIYRKNPYTEILIFLIKQTKTRAIDPKDKEEGHGVNEIKLLRHAFISSGYKPDFRKIFDQGWATKE